MADPTQETAEEGLSEKDLAEKARKLFAGPCGFVCAASEPAHFTVPQPLLPEVAFIGRSNVGKSSIINALTNRKALARASNTPGRTQQIIFFDLAERLRLVDLPGYGHAKVPWAVQNQWNGLMKCYLAKRAELCLVCILLDARRGVMEKDIDMMKRLDVEAVSYQLVYTKADLIKQSEREERLAEAREVIAIRPAARPDILMTGAAKGIGIEAFRTLLGSYALEKDVSY